LHRSSIPAEIEGRKGVGTVVFHPRARLRKNVAGRAIYRNGSARGGSIDRRKRKEKARQEADMAL